MEIKIVSEKNKAVVSLDGRLDTSTAPDLEAKLQDVISNCNSIVFDFDKLEYLSSAGLRVILSTHKAMFSKNGTLVIQNVNDVIMDVFDMTGFSSYLTIERK